MSNFLSLEPEYLQVIDPMELFFIGFEGGLILGAIVVASTLTLSLIIKSLHQSVG